MGCPVCGGSAIGKIGYNQFYCWDCCVEYSVGSQGFKVYSVNMDGTLMSIGESPLPSK